MRTAMIRRKSVIAVCTPATVVPRSALMSLIITFMFEPAKLQMNWASASGSRKRRRDSAASVTCRGPAALTAPEARSGVPARGELVDDHDVEDDDQEPPERGGREPDDLRDSVDRDEEDRGPACARASGEEADPGQGHGRTEDQVDPAPGGEVGDDRPVAA